MSGVVKGVKKLFKKVVSFVKKLIKPILIAAAVYFTAGLALSAFPATAGFAASLPGFAGGGILGTGIGAGATAGTGLFSKAASAIGLGSLGSSGGLVGGALASGTSTAALGAAGIKGTAILAGATKAAGAGLISGLPSGLATALAAGTPGVAGAGTVLAGGIQGPGMYAVGQAAKMSIGEKLLLASTGMQAVGALLAPSPAEQKRWVGAFYGMDRKGGGGAIVPGLPDSTQAPAAQQPGIPQVTPPTTAPVAPPQTAVRAQTAQPRMAQAPSQQPAELFAPPAPMQQSEEQPVEVGIPDLFKKMPGVRYA